jgi:uncharacterized membrane protein (UPF0127 family)
MVPLRSAAGLAALILFAASMPAQTAAQDPGPQRHQLFVETQSGRHVFEVELADDPQERMTGLMYRRELPKDHGMLFDFDRDETASMWMANTYVPLDMLFIKADGEVESIAERTTPLSRRSVVSKGPVRYVLEINAGLSDELGIKPGDTVSGPALEAVQ